MNFLIYSWTRCCHGVSSKLPAARIWILRADSTSHESKWRDLSQSYICALNLYSKPYLHLWIFNYIKQIHSFLFPPWINLIRQRERLQRRTWTNRMRKRWNILARRYYVQEKWRQGKGNRGTENEQKGKQVSWVLGEKWWRP